MIFSFNKFVILRFLRMPRRIKTIFFYLYWNRFLLYLSGVNFGKNLKAYTKVYFQIQKNSKVTIGDNFKFTSGEAFNPLGRNIRGCMVVADSAELDIGSNVGISSSCIWVNKKITIGNNVLIGGDCILLDSDCHSLNYVDRRSKIDRQNKVDADIHIGNDVLIGTRCIILKGVTIGDRVVIGSGSVVVKDIPNDCIAAGNPCRVVRRLIAD